MSYPIWLEYPYSYIFSAVFILIGISYFFLLKKPSGYNKGKAYDRRWTQMYIAMVGIAVLSGFFISFGKTGRIEWDRVFWFFSGLIFILAGSIIRLVAFRTLGKYFSIMVTIQQNHKLVKKGIYRLIRHPAYTGLFLFMLGIGLSLGNWLSLFIIFTISVTIAFVRVPLEEKVLIERFGDEYRSYMKKTKRYIPYLF